MHTTVAPGSDLSDAVLARPVEIIEAGPSLAVHPAVNIASHALHLPLPVGIIDRAARALPAEHGQTCTAVELPRTDRAVLYCHGGAFLCGRISRHLQLIDKLSEFAESPVPAVNYRMLLQHTIQTAIDDCYDASRFLRQDGYQPGRIVIAGAPAGGYLAFAPTRALLADGEQPAALALTAPLRQLGTERPAVNGALLPHSAFAALTALIAAHDETLYEPLDHITVQIWLGQVHVFQPAAPSVPEATRSLRQIGAYICSAASTRHNSTLTVMNRKEKICRF